MEDLTPNSWRKVRIVQAASKRCAVVMFFTRLAVPKGAKDILNLQLKTEDLTEKEALATGQRFEDAFNRLEKEAGPMVKRKG